MNFSRFKFKIFVMEALFFASAFAIGILSVLRIKEIIAAQKEITARAADGLPNAPAALPPELAHLGNLNIPSFITIEQFLAAFLFITIFFLFLIKTKYGGKILKTLFIIAIFAGAGIIFRVWMNDSLAIILAIILILARFAAPRIIIHDIVVIVAIVGVAINFGLSIDPFDAVLLLVIISVYDFLAVYATGHMVKMFKSTLGVGAVFAMIVPDRFSNLAKNVLEVEKGKEKISLNFSRSCSEVNSGRGGTSFSQKKEMEFAPSGFIYLGGGDLAFPLILGISAAMKYGAVSAIFVLIGAILGLLALNFIFTAQKEQRPMPAMPPLAVFSILGFLASLI